MSLQISDKPPPEGDTLAQRLEGLLVRLGSAEGPLSIAALGRIIGNDIGRPIGRSTATRWFNDGLIPDAFEIVAIARRAGTTVEAFMAGLKPPVKRRKKTPTRVKKGPPPKVRPAAAAPGRRHAG